jgi:hypothetical protein
MVLIHADACVCVRVGNRIEIPIEKSLGEAYDVYVWVATASNAEVGAARESERYWKDHAFV